MHHTINSYTSIIYMLSLLLKLSVCYFNAPLIKTKSNAIRDNSASHNIQQVSIYNTHTHIEVFLELCIRTTSTNSYTNHNL
jgi:hypothetical protein